MNSNSCAALAPCRRCSTPPRCRRDRRRFVKAAALRAVRRADVAHLVARRPRAVRLRCARRLQVSRCRLLKTLAAAPARGAAARGHGRQRRACCCVVGCRSADTRAPLCGPLVASRPPGDRKNTTNTHPIPLGHHPVSFELRGPGFWLGYIFFRAGGQSTNETPRVPPAPAERRGPRVPRTAAARGRSARARSRRDRAAARAQHEQVRQVSSNLIKIDNYDEIVTCNDEPLTRDDQPCHCQVTPRHVIGMLVMWRDVELMRSDENRR